MAQRISYMHHKVRSDYRKSAHVLKQRKLAKISSSGRSERQIEVRL